jgi:DNA-binding NtrC family response regulator
VARAIHTVSRRAGALVAFNVCAISDGLFEDTMFGHVKGAFTGATQDAAGYLVEANGGTVFMDEVSGLGLQAQAKLLRALETGVFRPVGASRDRLSDFRLLSASNENLTELSRRRAFRLDLLQRIGGCVLEVPSLDSRREDITQLAEYFLRVALSDSMITAAAIARLQDHSWAGNVRELRHVMERLQVIAGGEAIQARHVEASLRPRGRVDLEQGTDQLSGRQLMIALELHGWDIGVAALSLKMHRATLYRWMSRLGISVPASARIAKRVGAETATHG